MTSRKSPPDPLKPPSTPSGEHPAVVGFRKKMDSLEEALPIMQELNAEAQKLRRRSDPPMRPDRCTKCERIVRSDDETCPEGGEHKFVKETP